MPQHLLTFGVNLPGASYPEGKVWPFADPNGLRFEHEFVERLRNVPGVLGVSAVSGLPATEHRSRNRFVMEGRSTAEGQEEACITRRVGTRLLRGNEDSAHSGPRFHHVGQRRTRRQSPSSTRLG